MDAKRYPFKILESYTQADSDIYFGRDAEKDQLYEMIFQTNILLVYGPVGTGKTSLIQCGLSQRFDKYDWSCLFIRRSNDLNRSLSELIVEKIKYEYDEIEYIGEPDKYDSWSAPQMLSALYSTSFKPIYLFFDQFEELFILGDTKEENFFIDTIRQILDMSEPVKLIFCIREEYLGHLANFERKIPELFRKKIRVEPMSLTQVEVVLKSATSLAHSSIKLKEGEENEVCEAIFNTLKGNDKTIRIQLPYLQVYLHKLYSSLQDPSNATTTLTRQAIDDIGGLGDVLRDFLESEVRRLVSPVLSEGDIWKILSPFATLKGTKHPISIETLDKNVPDIKLDVLISTVQSFVTNKILRYIEDKELYEFVHDSIAQKVADKRDRDEINFLGVKQIIENQLSSFKTIPTYFNEQQLNFIDIYLERLNRADSLSNDEHTLIEDSRKKLSSEREKKEKAQLEKLDREKRKVWYITVTAFLLLFAFSSAIYFSMKSRATEQNRILQERINEANMYKQTGDDFRKLHKYDDARDSYKKALNVLHGAPGDLLYDELEKLIKECD